VFINGCRLPLPLAGPHHPLHHGILKMSKNCRPIALGRTSRLSRKKYYPPLSCFIVFYRVQFPPPHRHAPAEMVGDEVMSL
jgi:hypothetical protein